MGDWRSYDDIAERYDRVWSPRFDPVARRIWALMRPRPGDRALDIGTGTGIVLRLLLQVCPAPGLMVGCDRSQRMLLSARALTGGLRAVAVDAVALPFQRESFDVATASFVLSHVRNYPRALAEMLRILRRSGCLAVTSWGPSVDPRTAAWNDCLAEALSKPEAERAPAEVAPCEAHFSERGNLEAAVNRAGFCPISSDVVTIESHDLTLDQFVEDRELSAAGRLGLHLLGADGWARFRRTAKEQLQARFGSSFGYRRDAYVVIARKA